MRHVIVFSSGYRAGTAVHILTDVAADYRAYVEEAERVAGGLTAKVGELRYVGVEELPVSAAPLPAFYVVSFSEGGVEVVRRGDADLSRVLELKRRRLTVDFDGDPYGLVRRVFTVARQQPLPLTDLRFTRTYAGAHLRARLISDLGFEERVRVREMLFDDHARVEHDVFLASVGLEGLADCLFNEKWFKIRDGMGHYREEPLLLSRARLSFTVSEPYVDELVRVEGDEVIFARQLEPEEAFRVVSSLEERLWAAERERREGGGEEGFRLRQVSDDQLFNLVYSAYRSEVGGLAAAVVLVSRVEERDGVVYVFPPPGVNPGILIGRGGVAVKRVELVIGKRVRVVAEKRGGGEVDEVRRRIEMLKRRLVEE